MIYRLVLEVWCCEDAENLLNNNEMKCPKIGTDILYHDHVDRLEFLRVKYHVSYVVPFIRIEFWRVKYHVSCVVPFIRSVNTRCIGTAICILWLKGNLDQIIN